MFNKQELILIDQALEKAIEDQESYLKYGDPEADFEGDPEGLANMLSMPEKWAGIRKKILEIDLDEDEEDHADLKGLWGLPEQ